MESFVQDFRYALRSLRKAPGFTTIAVLTLGLGMGASTAIYTLLKRIVLDPLPYPRAGELVRLKSPVPGIGAKEEWNVSEGAYFFFQREAATVTEIGGYAVSPANVDGLGDPVRVPAAAVTTSLLHILGAQVQQGRLFSATDHTPGSSRVAVLSHAFWLRQFGGDPSVVGRSVQADARSVQVIGVLAPGLDLPPEPGAAEPYRIDIWMPMRLNPAGPFYNSHWIRVVARLAPGTTLQRAQAEFDQLTSRLPDAIPTAYGRAFVKSSGFRTALHPLKQYVLGDAARNLWILFAAVGVVLLVAYGNVANLLLVRIEGRRREMAIRSALGAGRGVNVRHHLTEGAVLALAGGTVALLIATWGVQALGTLSPPGLPKVEALQPDGSVLLFVLLLALAVAGGLSLLPALHERTDSRSAVLIEGGRSTTVGAGRQRVRSVLLVSQVALALTLIVGAGLLLRSFRSLRAVDPGIDPKGVLTLQLNLPPQRYDSLSKIWRFHDEMLRRVESLPGVTVAGGAWSLPFSGNYGCTVQGFEDAGVLDRIKEIKATLCADMVASTTPGYFEALKIPLIAGRTFNRDDNDHPENGAVVVSKTFAQRFWGDQNPIGKGVLPFNQRAPRYYRVVGVVGDIPPETVDQPPANAIYYPVTAIPGQPRWFPDNQFLIIRTSREPMSLLPEVREVLRQIDPAIPIADAEAMTAVVDRSMSRVSFSMLLLGVSAGAALLLAAIGLYGVVSYLVARRTNEIGVRIALGAVPAQVQRLVVVGSLRLTLMGIVIGVVLAVLVSRVLGSLLFGVRPTDPVSYLVAMLVLTGVAVFAAWLPARRAARVDPVVALRSE